MKRSDSGWRTGGSCYDTCGEDLECSSSMDVSFSSFMQSYCYNKTETFKVGDTCDRDETDVDDIARAPHVGRPFPKCFVPVEEDKHPLKCLPNGNDLICQEEARLFEHCSSKDHIVCEKGLVCSHTMSICVGKDEK